ncbi:MAG: undecaprenyl-diphosphate phosphatase [Candidatus Fermentibacter sp.]|nr:undecaprenyl-diphosphate phosphatase [Candidatus Fermentibacter sp.]
MRLLPVLLLALVQGIAEFLPISSSGHLALLGRFLGSGATGEGVLIEVILHLGTLCSVLVFYRTDLSRLLSGLSRGAADSWRLLLLLALASIPAAAVGLLFEDGIERAFSSPLLVAVLLGINGMILLVSGLLRRRTPGGSGPGLRHALAGGLAQAVAILPGISRSGSTISAMTASGMAQTDAAGFSFLMSIPAVAGAGLLEARGIASLDPADIPVALAGFAVSFLAGYASLRLLIGMLGRNRLWVFGVYCLVASVAATAVILTGG